MNWNTFAWHPRGATPLSNRTPTPDEFSAGQPALKSFLALFEMVPVVGVGEKLSGIEVFHPRRIVIPKVGSFFNGIFYGRCLIRALAAIRPAYAFDLIDSHFLWPDGYGAVVAA